MGFSRPSPFCCDSCNVFSIDLLSALFSCVGEKPAHLLGVLTIEALKSDKFSDLRLLLMT